MEIESDDALSEACLGEHGEVEQRRLAGVWIENGGEHFSAAAGLGSGSVPVMRGPGAIMSLLARRVCAPGDPGAQRSSLSAGVVNAQVSGVAKHDEGRRWARSVRIEAARAVFQRPGRRALADDKEKTGLLVVGDRFAFKARSLARGFDEPADFGGRREDALVEAGV